MNVLQYSSTHNLKAAGLEGSSSHEAAVIYGIGHFNVLFCFDKWSMPWHFGEDVKLDQMQSMRTTQCHLQTTRRPAICSKSSSFCISSFIYGLKSKGL